jgi:hypothetical protein
MNCNYAMDPSVCLPVAVWVQNLVSHFEGEHRLRVFENRVLRIFGPKREEDIVEKNA